MKRLMFRCCCSQVMHAQGSNAEQGFTKRSAISLVAICHFRNLVSVITSKKFVEWSRESKMDDWFGYEMVKKRDERSKNKMTNRNCHWDVCFGHSLSTARIEKCRYEKWSFLQGFFTASLRLSLYVHFRYSEDRHIFHFSTLYPPFLSFSYHISTFSFTPSFFSFIKPSKGTSISWIYRELSTIVNWNKNVETMRYHQWGNYLKFLMSKQNIKDQI